MAGLTLPTNNTFSQLNAIKSGANQNSLVSQLYAGNKSPSLTTQTSTPNVIAASSSVKSPTAPQPAQVQPVASYQGQGSSSLVGNPNANLYNYPVQQAPEAPTNVPVSSHTVNNADGSSVTQKYDTSQNLPDVNPNKEMTAKTPDSAPPTFGGLVGNVSDLSKPSAASSQALNTAQNSADTYNRLNEELAQSRKNQAGAEAENRLNPIPIGDQTGREAIIRNQYLAEQNAIASEAQGATNLYSPSIGAATTGTGQQITAAQGAANLAQPQVTAPGQAVFNPLTGQYNSASSGSGNPSSAPSGIDQGSWDNYVQMAANGQYSAIPASITGNTNLSGQLNAAAKIANPNYTPLGSQGAGSVLQGIPALQAANTAAQGIQNQITSYLSQNPTLNPSTLGASNAIQQWIQGKQLTDPKYQTLIDYLSEYTNTLAPILGVGGDPTNLKTEIAQGFINAQASGQSINEVLNNISQLADTKIKNIQSGANGGGVVNPNPSTPTGNSGGSLYSF